MLQLNRIEALAHSDLELYKIKNKNFDTQLKKIHNHFAVYINSVLEDLRNGDITDKVILYEGTEKYDGQRFILLDFINQIKRIISDNNRLSLEQKEAALLNLEDLINNISYLPKFPPGLISNSLEFLKIAQKQLISKPKPIQNILQQIRLKAKV